MSERRLWRCCVRVANWCVSVANMDRLSICSSCFIMVVFSCHLHGVWDRQTERVGRGVGWEGGDGGAEWNKCLYIWFVLAQSEWKPAELEKQNRLATSLICLFCFRLWSSSRNLQVMSLSASTIQCKYIKTIFKVSFVCLLAFWCLMLRGWRNHSGALLTMKLTMLSCTIHNHTNYTTIHWTMCHVWSAPFDVFSWR